MFWAGKGEEGCSVFICYTACWKELKMDRHARGISSQWNSNSISKEFRIYAEEIGFSSAGLIFYFEK